MIVVPLTYPQWSVIRSFLLDRGKIQIGQTSLLNDDIAFLENCDITVVPNREQLFNGYVYGDVVELHFATDEEELLFRLKYL